MRTMKEIRDLLQTKKVEDKMIYLYDRWQDEKEFENFNDYIANVKKDIAETVKGTKRPFGFKFQCSDGIYEVRITRTTYEGIAH